jgi:hypothetical protein
MIEKQEVLNKKEPINVEDFDKGIGVAFRLIKAGKEKRDAQGKPIDKETASFLIQEGARTIRALMKRTIIYS